MILTLCNIYAPVSACSAQQQQFYSNLERLLSNFPYENLCLAGDFNLALELVLNSLLQGIDSGFLRVEQRRGVICLIPKKDRDRLEIKNWRPITLLNVDLKILTKAIANKLVPCLRLAFLKADS